MSLNSLQSMLGPGCIFIYLGIVFTAAIKNQLEEKINQN